MGWEEVRKARQRLSHEQGPVVKDWGGRIPVALIYPNSYYVGMSNLGIHAVYSLLNSHHEVVCERVFRDEKTNRSASLSLESQRPLADFAILAFSVSYELDYFNVAQVLNASGIPLYAADRDESDPLVIAGGPCIIANPMPLSPFFDCLCIGEAEAIIPAMFPRLADGISGKRAELIKTLGSLPGIYVPSCSYVNKIARQWTANLDDFPVHSTVLTRDTELGDLYLIEVERGCNWGCRFCLVGSAFRPMRFRSLDSLISQAEQGLKFRRRLGLVGAAVPDHPHIEELVVRLGRTGAELSISSLRIKPFSDVVLREIARGGAKTIALAPEAGSQRLRDVVKKGIGEDDILSAVGKVGEQGIKHLKLYFMIGLPSETDEDTEEMVKLTVKCKDILDKNQAGARITLNIAPFVPKAGTPFQWLPMAPVATLKRRLALLKNSLPVKGVEVKSESPAWSEVQAALARGDATLAEVLAHMEEGSISEWRKAAERCHLDIDYYAHQRWDTEQSLPWAMIDSGTEPEKLKREMERALG
jgi:radical SAM superfamily enzyme YgiQ (UPF0313 family)